MPCWAAAMMLKKNPAVLDQSEIDALLGGGDAADEESSSLDQSEIDALLGGGDAADEESSSLDQSEIDALLGGGDAAEEESSSLGQSEIDALLGGGDDTEEEQSVVEEKEEFVFDESKIVESPAGTAYLPVEDSDIDELQKVLDEAKRRKREEDLLERARIKELAKKPMNKNKKKPTKEEMEERLIDQGEADELDDLLKNLKKGNR